MNIREPSQHLDRDKKPEDPLENILEPWGVWRQWGVDGLSSKRKSSIQGLNQLERRYTDQLDYYKRLQIYETLLKLGYTGSYLTGQMNKEYREWKFRINSMNVPRETCETKAKDPKYGGHKYYSKIDRLLSSIHGPYYNILIRKYEDKWEVKDFKVHWIWTDDVAWKQISRARKAAREILQKNGYKA